MSFRFLYITIKDTASQKTVIHIKLKLIFKKHANAGVYIKSINTIKANASRVGHIEYYGNPKDISVNTSGGVYIGKK